MEIGAKIYYDKLTGDVLANTGHRSGAVVETTVEQDFSSFVKLAERTLESVGIIQLQYGLYTQDFIESRGNFRVNPQTLALEFSYPAPNPEAPPVYQVPLTEQVAELKSQNSEIILTLVMNDLM